MRAKVTARRRQYAAVRTRLLSVLRVTWHTVLELLRHSAEALEGDGRLLLGGGHAHARSGRAAAVHRRKLQRSVSESTNQEDFSHLASIKVTVPAADLEAHHTLISLQLN